MGSAFHAEAFIITKYGKKKKKEFETRIFMVMNILQRIFFKSFFIGGAHFPISEEAPICTLYLLI